MWKNDGLNINTISYEKHYGSSSFMFQIFPLENRNGQTGVVVSEFKNTANKPSVLVESKAYTNHLVPIDKETLKKQIEFINTFSYHSLNRENGQKIKPSVDFFIKALNHKRHYDIMEKDRWYENPQTREYCVYASNGKMPTYFYFREKNNGSFEMQSDFFDGSLEIPKSMAKSVDNIKNTVKKYSLESKKQFVETFNFEGTKEFFEKEWGLVCPLSVYKIRNHSVPILNLINSKFYQKTDDFSFFSHSEKNVITADIFSCRTPKGKNIYGIQYKEKNIPFGRKYKTLQFKEPFTKLQALEFMKQFQEHEKKLCKNNNLTQNKNISNNYTGKGR